MYASVPKSFRAVEATISELQDYAKLSPHTVLEAIESVGYQCDGSLLALNSYENRVYRARLEDGDFIVAKFYRPARWSDQAILEEHQWSMQLAELEIPVVPPLLVADQSLLQYQSYRFALFPNRGGRAPDLENFDQLTQMGRFLGRIHRSGQQQDFSHRPTLDIEQFGGNARDFILQHDFIPADLLEAYQSTTDMLLEQIGMCYERAGDVKLIRCHADCHPGNILWSDDGPHIVDFDDARMAPAVQDIWMFISGERSDQIAALDAILEGYTEFADFDARELHLIEALRSLRLIHYYGWLAKRWHDPAFKRAFVWFNDQQCWENHILTLREQLALIHEPALAWGGFQL